ncbi:MAG: hypothetical protein ACI9DH_000745 [Halioglobus sp.]|jgi:hypothetical protein
MYRSDGDQSISYTVEDLLLFKESPFASWMERLTLENPLHGIAPDESGKTPGTHDSFGKQEDHKSFFANKVCVESVQWSDLVDHRSQQKVLGFGQRYPLSEAVSVPEDFVVVAKMDDVRRRQETLDAMRDGVNFIINAQLSVGPLSGDVDLLMRSSGASELGSYRYIPCDTREIERPHSAIALCYVADLLHSVQGVLPSKLLIIRGKREPVPLNTEDHIYHYRAVKQSFMSAQGLFKKHCMPNPEDSASFGRWSGCANEVMKRRVMFSLDQSSAVKEGGVEFEQKSGIEGGADVAGTSTEHDLQQKLVRQSEPPSPQLRSVKSCDSDQSYVDLDWPGSCKDSAQQTRFNDRLMTSNGSDL